MTTSQNPFDQLPDPDEVPTEVSEATCDKHGEYEETARYYFGRQSRPVRSPCPECARIAKRQREEQERRDAEAKRQLRVDALLSNARIPARYAARGLGEFRAESKGQKFALSVCTRFTDDFPAQAEQGRSLVMVGAPGTGKTHLACAIAKAVIEKHQASALFATVSEMLRAIKETYRHDSERTERDVIRKLTDADLLVVDELGVQIGSDHEKLLLFEVLNSRYQELRPTILISNLSAEDLEEFLGHRIMDRYRECGVVLAFDWESYRGRKAA